jgi:hypothetical protein
MKTVNEGLLDVARTMTLATRRLEYRLENLARFVAVIAVNTGMTPEEVARALEVAFANADAAAERDLQRLDADQPDEHPASAAGPVAPKEA